MRLVKSRLFSFVLVSVQKEVIAMGRIGWIKKIMIIVLGSMLAAYGITLALYAGFGGATLAIVWQGMSKTFHISIGMASLIVALIMIVFVFFYIVCPIRNANDCLILFVLWHPPLLGFAFCGGYFHVRGRCFCCRFRVSQRLAL